MMKTISNFYSFLKFSKKNLFLGVSMLMLLPFFVIGLLLFTHTIVVYGQGGGQDSGSGTLPTGAIGVFGGRITAIIQCTCRGGHVILVSPPRSGRFKFGSGSKLYEYGQIKRVGAWVLGTYTPPSICERRVCPCGGPKEGCCCKDVFHNGTIQIVGTSR